MESLLLQRFDNFLGMRESNKGKEQPEFMSPPPSSTNRIKTLSEWESSVILDYPPNKIS